MKVTIYRVPLNQLWNSEYCMFVSQLVIIFLKFNPALLHLQKAFDRVQALMPEIAKIKAQELGNVISIQLADLNSERRTLMMGIIDLVKTFGKLSMPSLAQHVVALNRFLDKHGRDIGESNYNSNSDRFTDLLTDYNSNAEIKAAALALNIVIMFDHLQVVNTQFTSLYLQRSDEDSSIETVDARAIRTETDKALIAFYNAFEFCSTEYEELDYQTPANKMNDLISHYKTELKARATRRNAGDAVHTETPIINPTEIK